MSQTKGFEAEIRQLVWISDQYGGLFKLSEDQIKSIVRVYTKYEEMAEAEAIEATESYYNI